MKMLSWKRSVLHGLTAGILAATACMIYLHIYNEALGVDFKKIINPGAILSSCIFGCMLMAIGYAILQKFGNVKYTGILNMVIAILSFASIVGPIASSLPLDITNPELFPGLAIPMHFFPALAFFAIVPFFIKINNNG